MPQLSSGEIAYYASLQPKSPAASNEQILNMARYQNLTLTETPQQKYQRESRGDADPNYRADEAARIASFNARGPAEVAARTTIIRNFESNPSFGTQAHMDYVKAQQAANQAAARSIEEANNMPVSMVRGPSPEQEAQRRANERFQSDSQARAKEAADLMAASKTFVADAIAARAPQLTASERAAQEAARVAASAAALKQSLADLVRIKAVAAAKKDPVALAAIEAAQLRVSSEITRIIGLQPSVNALTNSAGLLNHGTSNAEAALDVALLTPAGSGAILAATVNDARAAKAALAASRGVAALAKPKPVSRPKPRSVPKPARPKGKKKK